LEQVSQECANPVVGFDPVAALARLYDDLRRLAALPPGQYVLHPELPPHDAASGYPVKTALGENVVHLCKATDETAVNPE
jgi:hypothetical protein